MSLDTNAVKRRLIEEKDRLATTVAELADGLDLDEAERSSLGELTPVDQHPADAGSETFEREKDAAILTTLTARASEIDAALERVERGTYGKCETCGEEIPVERLDMFPDARFCVAHQSEQESD